MGEWSRREFVRLATVGAGMGIAGCSGRSPSESTENYSQTRQTSQKPARSSEPVSGRVVDIDGDEIAGATLNGIVPTRGSVVETTTDNQGRFEVAEVDEPIWLRATKTGFIGRTVAVAPGTTPRIRLSPRAGTVALSFGGDVMFGRRFYEDDDPLEPHFQIRPDDRLESHQTILQYISPLLQDADITSVNLETPLTTTAWRHPSKRYHFVSHPDAAPAMASAGIDYVALGNNHTFDALTPGLNETLEVLSSAGIERSGAGKSGTAAWEPAYFEEQGLTVGLLSCTALTGGQYEIDWVADDGQSETYSVPGRAAAGVADAEELTVSGNVGTAAATHNRLSREVSRVDANADVTVVQIHGGTEYQREPTDEIRRLTEAASVAGADVVVNHHSHVTGGLELRDGTLVAWSLGNLVFEQELWPTFPSYVLSVHVTADGVTRAYADPLLLKGYVPKGVVGKPREWQLRETAALSADDFSLSGASLEYVTGDETTTRTVTRTLDGDGTIYTRNVGWVTRVVDREKSVELGRDLLPTGTFDDPDVDDERHEGPLWRFSRGADSNGPEFGYDGSGGVRLSRTADNSQRSILTTTERVPVTGPTTLLGRYRHETDARLELLVRWYESTSSSALESVSTDLDRTAGWERIEWSSSIPENATHVRFYFRLYPPDDGEERAATVDDLRLVEWSEADVGGGKDYDHLRVHGSATVQFSSNNRSGDDVTWNSLE
ncbi:CapA family protein [Halorussus litoreus]|uniref:CapA family protein n=1 Tax=Halorussus litoreus TaxID=1710536 RepID=UPI000E27CADB|nr:CapA family protein [Halorussus litoreus]